MISLKIRNYDLDEMAMLSFALKTAHEAIVTKYCITACEHCVCYKICQDLSQARFYLEKKLDEI